MLFAIILGANAFIGAVFCGYLAREKRRDVASWAVLGFLFGIPALLLLGFTPAGAILSSDDEWKKCTVCAEFVKQEALKCRYCGESFDISDEQLTGGSTSEVDPVGYEGRTYAPPEDQEGYAFCLGCRLSVHKSELLYNAETNTYFHRRCIPN